MNAVKEFLKENSFFVDSYRFIIGIICYFSPVIASKIMYRVSTGKRLNLKDPSGFNEKLMWLKLYDRDPLKTKCADKLLVREYVQKKGCKEILNDLYGVYNNVEDIPWDQLPDRYVLKCTYGAGSNVIVPDKSKVDIAHAEQILKEGLRPRVLDTTAEIHYSSDTNKIVCEKFIETNQGNFPNDYKIYCFNGEPKAVLAMTGRDTEVSKMFYDVDWNPMKKYSNETTSKGSIDKPKNLDLLLDYARKLSEDFPFVRVDLYDTGEEVIFGELTFTPAACLSKAHSPEGDRYFGKLLNLAVE